jgi:hypothetical protein
MQEQKNICGPCGALAAHKSTPTFRLIVPQMASNAKIVNQFDDVVQYEKLMSGVLVGRMLLEGSQARQFLSVMKELEPLLLESDWPQFRRVVIQAMVGLPCSDAFSYCDSALWDVFVESHPNRLAAVKVYTNQKVRPQLDCTLQLTWVLTCQQRSDATPAAASASEAKDLKEQTPKKPAPEPSPKPAPKSAAPKLARRGRSRNRSRSRSRSPGSSKVRDRKDRSRSRG